MAKYLWEVSYTAEGARGLMKEGGTRRRKVIDDLLNATGGRLEAFYFAFGKHDAFIIADIPDNASAAAICLTVNASGAVAVRTTVLLTPEEVDKAAEKSIAYSSPGQ